MKLHWTFIAVIVCLGIMSLEIDRKIVCVFKIRISTKQNVVIVYTDDFCFYFIYSVCALKPKRNEQMPVYYSLCARIQMIANVVWLAQKHPHFHFQFDGFFVCLFEFPPKFTKIQYVVKINMILTAEHRK